MGYHAITYGWLVGEIIRRISGKSPGTFVRDEIAGPVRADFMIGTPASEDHRIADMLQADGPSFTDAFPPDSLFTRALGVLAPAGADVNSREWRAAEIPAANGHGNARALAHLYSAFVRGEIVSPETVELFPTERVSGTDVVLGFPWRRGLGFILNSPQGRVDYGPGPRSFGHDGAGGSFGFADPDRSLGFGYAMNQMYLGMDRDPRWLPLIEAVYAIL